MLFNSLLNSERGFYAMYVFRSSTGTFTIGADITVPSGYELCVGGMWLGSYETPEKAAEAVCLRCTGWLDWDRGDGEEAPGSLEEWETLE